VIVTGASPGYKWIMTGRPFPENSSEFFVEWQIAEDADRLIDLSVDPGEAAARMAEQGEVTVPVRYGSPAAPEPSRARGG
jgi:hypothetical protein